MLKREIEVARSAVSKAGEILAAMFGNINRIVKKGKIDLVTEADLESERHLIRAIKSAFPEDMILSEERGATGEHADRTWIIDPLDGTTNFVHGVPFYAVSIGLEIKGEVVLGTVYSPPLEEMFEAVKGRGAYLNNVKINVSITEKLEDSLLCTGFPYTVCNDSKRILDHFKKMLTSSQSVLRPGSAALDLCYVASGRFDGFWEEGLKPWDTAGAAIIVEEAGGVVTDDYF